MKMAPQGAAKTALGGGRNDSLCIRNDPLSARNDSLRIRNDLVRARNGSLCGHNNSLSIRNDPLHVHNGLVRVRNEALSGRNDIIEKLKVESWKVEIRGCQKDCVRVIRNADHRIGQKDRGGEDGNLKTET